VGTFGLPSGLPSGLGGIGFPPPIGLPGVPSYPTKAKKQPRIPLKACNYAVLTYDKIKGTIW
jgi:hypothetical protein